MLQFSEFIPSEVVNLLQTRAFDVDISFNNTLGAYFHHSCNHFTLLCVLACLIAMQTVYDDGLSIYTGVSFCVGGFV